MGLDPAYQQSLDDGGFRVVGIDGDGEARLLELPDLPFYVAALFVPQTRSTPQAPHPLVTGLLQAAIDRGTTADQRARLLTWP